MDSMAIADDPDKEDAKRGSAEVYEIRCGTIHDYAGCTIVGSGEKESCSRYPDVVKKGKSTAGYCRQRKWYCSSV